VGGSVCLFVCLKNSVNRVVLPNICLPLHCIPFYLVTGHICSTFLMWLELDLVFFFFLIRLYAEKLHVGMII